MLNRSELRHACFRVKNGVATDANMELFKQVEPLLDVHQSVENFQQVWDLYVNKKTNKIVIITPETDVDFIRATCQEKQFHEKYKAEPNEDDWTPRKQNIIAIVEVLMLDNVMNWLNYGTAWGVSVDLNLKTINAKLFTPPTQKEVTEDMIQASKVSSDDSVYVGVAPTELVLNTKPMSEAESEAFKQFLATQNPKE
jgi:hypothetical protein